MDQDWLIVEVRRLQKRERVLRYMLAGLWVAFVSAALFGAHALHTLAHRDTLTLRRLEIVDAKGTPRVILASPVPVPTRFGKPGRRDGPMSGILIADATGTERGGYATSDGQDANALLTLDAQGKQTFLMLAEPTGNTLFRIWNADKGSLVMGVSDSAPFLNVRQKDHVFFSAPENNAQVHDPRPLFR